ncbi:HAD family hydrolase [Nonomuraea sp. MCN248]|uniref:HAD family hydrolase n=1 Tax=Nonomuraea corallina TaxID=2989783 RepID=A0ABT4SN19_9ACTN|nr:HAD family hydrolase [Nonomuraea corallina]MDA0638638.1 HAD family hydrolase [Nonomuraea corallina]
MTRAVLFDLDGTLVDSRPAILDCYRAALAPVPRGWETLLELGLGRVMRWRMREVMAVVAGDRAAECESRYERHYLDEGHRKVVLYPGAVDLLDALREQGSRLGIVTNKGRVRTEHDLRTVHGTRDLLPLFDVVVTTEDTTERKPSPAPILLGLQRAGWTAGDCVYVGDGPHDAEAALAAGTGFVGAGWGYYPDELASARPPLAVAAVPGELTGLLPWTR